MYEDFIISEAYSRYSAVVGNCDSDDDVYAQDMLWEIKQNDHADFCKSAAKACLDFLKTNNLLLRI